MEKVDVSVESALALARNMHYASRLMNDAVTEELARHRLLPSEFEVLRLLADRTGGRARSGDLVCAGTTTASGMSRLVDRLIGQGLVERTSGVHDRRVQTVTITPAGRARLTRACQAHRVAVARVLSDSGLEGAPSERLSVLLGHLAGTGLTGRPDVD